CYLACLVIHYRQPRALGRSQLCLFTQLVRRRICWRGTYSPSVVACCGSSLGRPDVGVLVVRLHFFPRWWIVASGSGDSLATVFAAEPVGSVPRRAGRLADSQTF